MHINQTLNNTARISINGQVSIDMGLPALSEGDSITARVIFSGAGTAHLKTSEGALLRARLEGGLVLPEGSEVTLMVEEKSTNSLTLRITDIRGADSGTTSSATARHPALPPALAAVFEQIQSSGLPIAQKLELFTKALADFPSLNTQSASVQQAMAALASGDNARPPVLGQMLAELSLLLSNLETTTPGGQSATTTTAPAAVTTANPAAPTAVPGPSIATTAGTTAPNNTVATTDTAATATLQTATATTALPSTGSTTIAIDTTAGANITVAATDTATTTAPLASNSTAATTFVTTANTTETAAPLSAAPATDGATPAPSTAATTIPASTAAHPPAMAAVTTTAPPPEALQAVRQMAGELYPPGQAAPRPKDLGQFIERLFARVGRTAEQGGTELQKCARELEVRLNLLQEAINKSSLPQREELLSQTGRILQQTEALREARLFCMQLPIQFEQQRQTAELYIYRRDRHSGRKLDPQNATILLALNTEHLGRLEALIQTRGREINLKLEIARAEALPLVREYSRALPRLLQEAGFRLNSSSIEHLRQETNSPQAAERALTGFQRNFEGKLDLFI